MTDRRMFPPGTPISPSGWVVVSKCGRTIAKVGPRSSARACWWCAQECPKGRHTWCSKACVEEARSRWPSTIRLRALRRDRGLSCPLCGDPRGGREVDHIVPIVEGGHPWDMDNLRCICSGCHAHETRCLAARRAEAKPDRSGWIACERRPGSDGRPRCSAAILGSHRDCTCDRVPPPRRSPRCDTQISMFTAGVGAEANARWNEQAQRREIASQLRPLIRKLSWWARRRAFERIAERRAEDHR